MADSDKRERSTSPEFEIPDDNGRPLIHKSGVAYKFRPGQLVYLRVPGSRQTEGPYKIESARGAGKYTICHANGQTARGGAVVDETDLTTA
ncbi:hypothetical protein TruAng_009836 [Truncatella angustata]|nr:hypothetical protein TruAng_009836 [Truncatella angustata]